MLFSALAAAAPTPSSAFFSSFRFFAASFDAEKLVPVRMEMNSATIVTIRVIASTSAVNAGSTTPRIGCANVRSAPLSRESAAVAASFCRIVSPSQSRKLDSAREISPKNSA